VAQSLASHCYSMRITLHLRNVHRSYRKLSRASSRRNSHDSTLNPHMVAKSQASPVQKRMDDQRKRRLTELCWWRLSCENSNSQARDFGLPSSPNLPFRDTDSCGNWYRAFAVEFCSDNGPSTFPRPSYNTHITVSLENQFRERENETSGEHEVSLRVGLI